MFPNILPEIERRLEAAFGNDDRTQQLLQQAEEVLAAERHGRTQFSIVNVGERYTDAKGGKYGSKLLGPDIEVPDDHFVAKGHKLPADHLRTRLLVVFLFLGWGIVRLRMDEEGKVKREVYLYEKDIVHITLVRKRVLRIEHPGGEHAFHVLLPDYWAAVRAQNFIEKRRCWGEPILQRA